MKNNSAFERDAMQVRQQAFMPKQQPAMWYLRRLGQVVYQHPNYSYCVAERNSLCRQFPNLYKKEQFKIEER